MYKELENDANLSYWSDITTIVQDELEKLRTAEGGAEGVRRDGIHHAVAQDVTQVLLFYLLVQLHVLTCIETTVICRLFPENLIILKLYLKLSIGSYTCTTDAAYLIHEV